MQNPNRLSLNSVRVFEAAARHGSHKLAAEELSVTPSAVSHQIKSLEDALGVALFTRKNNAIVLTETGRRFHADVAPGLAIIKKSAQALQRDANELVVRSGVSFAVRWLIPALEKFERHLPDSRIRVETTHNSNIELTPNIDLAIIYARSGDAQTSGERLIGDASRPVLSPSLLSDISFGGLQDVGNIAAICCSVDNWDWRRWAAVAQVKVEDINFGHEFDTDDAAIHGAVAGMGMVLAPPIMTEREIAANSLVELPYAPPVEMGTYRLLSAPHARPLVNRFRTWLVNEIADEHD